MPGRDRGGEDGAGLRMAENGKVVADELPDPADIEPATAEEVVRQAQKVIETQIAAANAVDQKIVLLLQQSVTLASAAFAACGVAFSTGAGAWLSGWGGYAFLATGSVALLAAFNAGHALGPSQLSAPGIVPSTVWRAGFVDRGRVAFYGNVLGALERAIDSNNVIAQRSGRRYRLTLLILVSAPLAGIVVAAIYWALSSRTWWPVPILAILSAVGLFRAARS